MMLRRRQQLLQLAEFLTELFCLCRCQRAIRILINKVGIVILQPDFTAFSNLPCKLHSVSPFELSNLSFVIIQFKCMTSLCAKYYHSPCTSRLLVPDTM